jgi:nicotinate-nucleotide adenylyltransferase
MVEIAIEDNEKLTASNIEFKLPQPSYTSNTLAYLKEKHPKHEFSLIMGEDNLRTLHKWRNYEEILANHSIYVYPRALTEQERTELKEETKTENNLAQHKNIIVCDAPVMKVSASFIRNAIKNKKDVRYLLTESVHNYVEEMNFYKK